MLYLLFARRKLRIILLCTLGGYGKDGPKFPTPSFIVNPTR